MANSEVLLSLRADEMLCGTQASPTEGSQNSKETKGNKPTCPEDALRLVRNVLSRSKGQCTPQLKPQSTINTLFPLAGTISQGFLVDKATIAS